MNEVKSKPALTVRQWANRITLAMVVSAVLALAAIIIAAAARHNFHIVSRGLVYRSAQLDGAGFRRIIRENGIKSIFNLRGLNQAGWYEAETNAAGELGVAHYDFALSASEQLNNTQMENIVSALASAPKPILIHCKNGADRSGLVGALYLYTQEGWSAEASSRELTIFCGHFPYLFWRDTIAMDDSFSRFTHSHAQSGSVVLSGD